MCGAAQALAREDPTTSPPESSKFVLDKLGSVRQAVRRIVHENQDFNAIRDDEFTHAGFQAGFYALLGTEAVSE